MNEKLSSRDTAFICFGVVLSFLTFFYVSTNYGTHFVHAANHEYQQFSSKIFEPQTRFYAESILLPLIAKLIGASKSGFAYQMLTAIFQFAIMPLVALVLARRIPDNCAAITAILIFALSFTWLRDYWLGFPDPITILCLIVASSAARPVLVWWAALLASLSHFTLTIFGLAASFAILGVNGSNTTQGNLGWRTRIWVCIISMSIGKLILLLWFWVFKYSPQGRFAYVIDAKLEFFIGRYVDNPSSFWITPGIIFIVVNFVLFLFLLTRRRLLAIGQVGALLIAYICLFLSEDGLRIFSVVICASYVLLLIHVIPDMLSTLRSNFLTAVR